MTVQDYPVVVGPPAYGPGAVSPAPGPSVPAGPGEARGSLAVWVAAGVALVASAAALTVGLVAVNTAHDAKSAPAGSTTITAAPAAPILFDDTADRALCQAIPDLMRERDSADRVFQAFPTDSHDRVAAIPGFKADVDNWARQMQTILAAHATPNTYLVRTLQRYIDDALLYSQNIYPDNPNDKFNVPTWTTGVVDYGGALGRCHQLGLDW